MSNPKRHHYLPELYLKYFCKEDKLWVFDKELATFREQTPVNTGVQSHYYSVVTEDGNKDTTIERLLANIEGQVKVIIDKLLDREKIACEEKGSLSVFIAFMFGRVPFFEKYVNNIHEQFLKKLANVTFNSEENIKELMDQMEKETGENLNISAKDFLKFHQDGKYKFVIHRNASLQIMSSLSPEIAGYFNEMDWVIFHAPTNTSFITTDNPVTLTSPPGYDPKSTWGYGIITSGVKKVFPLSQTACLIMHDRGDRIIHQNIDKQRVRIINLELTASADRFVIARDEYLLRNLVRRVQNWAVSNS